MSLSLLCPALLTLGAGRLNGQRGMAAMALRVPVMSIEARSAPSLAISGPCADVAQRITQRAQQKNGAEIEIESALPRHMGLGADLMMAEAIGDVLTRVSGTSPRLSPSVAGHAFAQGGLIFVNEGGELLRRSTLQHDDANAWVFVLLLPTPPDNTPDDLESARAQSLLNAAPGHDLGKLFAAADDSNFDGFVSELRAMRNAQASTLRKFALPAELQPYMQLLEAQNAPFTSIAATGYGMFAVTRGAPASRVIRSGLKQTLGYGGPIVLGSICDNLGAQRKP